MAETLGMVVEFRGETTQFDQAVKKLNGELKETKSEISLVNKELKLDPKNVEALTKKFDLLKNKEKELAELTETLKKGMANLDPNSKEWANYNKQLQNTSAELGMIRKELSTMPSPTLKLAADGLKEYGQTLENIGGKLESIGGKLSILSGGVVGLATAGVKFNARLEQYQTAFTTLIGSEEEAVKLLDEIQTDASASPFNTDALVEANQYLISAGVEGEEARDTIKALGDAIAATGGGSNELSRMAQNLQQIKNLGKASSVDIKQFANAGINVYALLSDYTGKSVEQLKDMDIGYEVLTNALKQASSEGGRYAGAMDRQSQTINGSLASMQDSINQLLGELTKELLPVVKNILTYANDLIKMLKAMSPETKAMVQNIAMIIAALGPGLTLIGGITTKIGGLAVGISNLLKSEKIVSFFAKVSSSGGGLSGVLKTITGALGGVGTAIAVVVAVLTALYFSNENVRNAINSLASTLGGAFASALKLVSGLMEAAGNVFSFFVDIVNKLWDAIKNSTAWDIFINFITTALDWVNQFIGAFQGLIGWIQKGVDWFNNLFRSSENAGNSINKVQSSGFDHGMIMSGGFQSGGFMSGGSITISNTFNVGDVSGVSQAVLNSWADRMTDRLNENLGRMYA